MPELLDRLSQLQNDTIVVHTSIMQDASGESFVDPSQSVSLVTGAANAPVFVLDDASIGGGAVGGAVLSWAAQGRASVGKAIRILQGENPKDIPVAKTETVNLFDWRARNAGDSGKATFLPEAPS